LWTFFLFGHTCPRVSGIKLGSRHQIEELSRAIFVRSCWCSPFQRLFVIVAVEIILAALLVQRGAAALDAGVAGAVNLDRLVAAHASDSDALDVIAFIVFERGGFIACSLIAQPSGAAARATLPSPARRTAGTHRKLHACRACPRHSGRIADMKTWSWKCGRLHAR